MAHESIAEYSYFDLRLVDFKKEKPAKKPALGTITLIANQPEIDQNYQ